jgi:hypothetical protein
LAFAAAEGDSRLGSAEAGGEQIENGGAGAKIQRRLGGSVSARAWSTAAVRALQVFKLDQSYAGAGGRPEGGGVVHRSSRGRREKLGVDPGGGDKKRGYGEAQKKAGRPAKSGAAMGISEKMRHSD